MARKKKKIYTIKVECLLVTPNRPCRVLEVYSSLPLFDLAALINKAFRFEFSENFIFYDAKSLTNIIVGEPSIGKIEENAVPTNIEDYEMNLFSKTYKISDARKKRIEDLVRRVGEQAYYVYDLSDNWIFILTLVEIKKTSTPTKIPKITKCPQRSMPIPNLLYKDYLDIDSVMPISADYETSFFGEGYFDNLSIHNVRSRAYQRSSILEYLTKELKIPEENIRPIANKILSAWNIYSANTKEITISTVAAFARELLARYPDDVDIILFLKDLSYTLVQAFEKSKDIPLSMVDLSDVTTPPKLRFPIFLLINQMLPKRLMSHEELDKFVFYLVTNFREVERRPNYIISYFQSSFKRKISAYNSLSFLIILLSRLEDFFKAQYELELFVDTLLKNFEDNSTVKNWIVHLIISGFIYANTIGYFSKRALEQLFSNNQLISTFLGRDVTEKESNDNFKEALDKLIFSKPIHEFSDLNKLIPKIYAFIGAPEEVPEKLDTTAIAKAIFIKLYEHIFKSNAPLDEKEKDVVLDELQNLTVSWNCIFSVPLKIALMRINIVDKNVFIGLLDLLYAIAYKQKPGFRDTRITLLKIIVNSLVHHRENLGIDLVIKKLEEYKNSE
ncbi:MAG: hypothetical protein J7L47_03280, partial [Candidatus Odinarchaeota archaeon]|nr:hypothetical protein [Candidatus Odinarchaeota archaeon]